MTVTLPALITALALVLYMVLTFNVGRARGKYGIKAPATTGNEDFERVYRVQMNTLEQIVFFLPSLWLFALFLEAPKSAAILGGVWIIGRILFAHGYYQEPKKRSLGFMISLFSASILLLGGIVGIVMHLIG